MRTFQVQIKKRMTKSVPVIGFNYKFTMTRTCSKVTLQKMTVRRVTITFRVRLIPLGIRTWSMPKLLKHYNLKKLSAFPIN